VSGAAEAAAAEKEPKKTAAAATQNKTPAAENNGTVFKIDNRKSQIQNPLGRLCGRRGPAFDCAWVNTPPMLEVEQSKKDQMNFGVTGLTHIG
jgi:hypothetical protein